MSDEKNIIIDSGGIVKTEQEVAQEDNPTQGDNTVDPQTGNRA